MPINMIHVNVVTPGGVLENTGVTIHDGLIDRIGSVSSRGEVIDAQGAYLMPGMIDIHSDQIEQAVEPRPGSVIDIAYALQEQEKQLINHGITTMFQSLSMWKITSASGKSKAAREQDFMQKLVREILKPDPARLITHLLHIRLDLTNPEIVPVLVNMIDDGQVSLLSFMDHTPGQGQYRDLDRHKAALRGNSPGATEKEIDELIEKRMRAPKIPLETLIQIAGMAKHRGISLASHDDDSFEKVDFVRNVLGASISEFPVEAEIARYAKQAGMITLGGAPNVLNGKSHAGNMSAAEGILDGSINALCSDYYPPAMLQSVFLLHRQYGLPLNECVNLVSLSPARAVGIDKQVGSIELGKRADLILVDVSEEYPRLISAITKGFIASTLRYSYKACCLRSAG